jgi:membrane protease YdiL (CAAX protease family)
MTTGRLCLAYLAAIVVAELVTKFADPLPGIILYFTLLLLLIVGGAAAHGRPSHRRLLLALGLAPLMRILGLAMPLEEFSEIYWYLIVAVPLLVGVFAVVIALNLNPADIGLARGAVRLQALVAAAGMVFGLVEYFILRPEPLIDALTWGEILVPALILLVATGLTEELVFRGVMQRASAEVLGSWGWVFVAAVFTLLQIGHGSALHVLFVFPVALLFGWTAKRTGSIVGVSLSHGLANVGLFLIFPFAFG